MAVSEDTYRELLPVLDFPRTRQVLRTLYLVCAGLALLGFGALFFIELDVVVRAQAVVAPVGETARVQAQRSGVVADISVREGQQVEQGAVLLRLDDAQVRTRKKLLEQQVAEARGRVSMLEALVASRADAYGMQVRVRKATAVETVARLEAARAQVSAKEREAEARARDARQAEQLKAKEFVASVEVENAAMQAEVARSQVEAARAAARELEASLGRLELEQRGLEGDARVASLADGAALAAAKVELERYEGELEETRLEVARWEVVAPRAGTVQGLTVFDRGDVVQAGSVLGLVVPSEDALVVRAAVTSEGITFLREGQAVRIKLDGYPFQDFGVLLGELSRVAGDTTRRQDDTLGASPYRVDVRVPEAPRSTAGVPVKLRPGMTGTAEFVVRRERLVSALMRPLRGVDSLGH
ncbi:HlyD family secretion protein [Myxococcus sp. K38C18041901]|uniref:HlyD family efflux transporter periplasmic adaptor subunit n=1 Tax=Myxococcus guangdongensis TaxID=2906760 RepID=UPI0020A74920|nr:HlyD family efflux transporter periplasmic adaptor subunit [Myxococcus guangdongensis]MCP3063379.1 HlyD family secretion protein [Myxococcus guangdongensis]